MRTTIDLPDDLHRIAMSIARDRHQSLSKTVVDLIQRGLGTATEIAPGLGDRDGFPTFTGGKVITEEDVRRLDDE
jgi:predicted transcriptional regulator